MEKKFIIWPVLSALPLVLLAVYSQVYLPSKSPKKEDVALDLIEGSATKDETDVTSVTKKITVPLEVPKPSKTYDSPPPATIDTQKNYSATIETTKGTMIFSLFASEVPITVNNFVFLARDNFYEGIKFHRIIKDFMVQAGDPDNGTGGPGYTFADEPVVRDYKRGTLAMANAGPDTNGSQFFIIHSDSGLPKNYTIFGELTKGEETLDKIANTPVVPNAMGEASKPTESVTIKSVKIQES